MMGQAMYGDFSYRRVLVCGAVFVHGLRMGIGALVIFGKNTGFTYCFEKDLQRYEYAKLKWEHEVGKGTWWLKQVTSLLLII